MGQIILPAHLTNFSRWWCALALVANRTLAFTCPTCPIDSLVLLLVADCKLGSSPHYIWWEVATKCGWEQIVCNDHLFDIKWHKLVLTCLLSLIQEWSQQVVRFICIIHKRYLWKFKEVSDPLELNFWINRTNFNFLQCFLRVHLAQKYALILTWLDMLSLSMINFWAS